MNDSAEENLVKGSASSSPDDPAPPRKFRPLRVWPAWLFLVLIVLARIVPQYLEGGLSTYWPISMFGPLLGCLLLLIWWVAASRATWKERLFGFLGLIGGLAIIVALAHPTMRGPATMNLTLPMGMVLFAVTAALLASGWPVVRTGVALLAAFVGFGYSTLLRSEGMTGEYALDTRWRWTSSAEESMLATRPPASTNTALPAQNDSISSDSLANPEWPAFRGADRAGRSPAPQIATNWSSNPPRQVWKIAVGPAWSSFSVAGNFLFTQEQRGPAETVVCYDAQSGREVWHRQVEARFDDPMGGPGPRATPTIADGGLFVMGATGICLRLDPATGAIIWQQDLKSLAGREAPPMWGFSASPLVIGSVVILYAGGASDKGLLALDAATGTVRWSVATGNEGYSSPQLNTIAGEDLVLMLSNDGLVCVEPATGKVRLNYEWKFKGYRALQPTVVAGTILLPTSMNAGTRAIRITKKEGELSAEELWTSPQLNPDFTDFVEHQGFLYGIDGGIFTCADLKTGEQKWKGGRYGKGQVLLLENSGMLLVSAEDGRVVLVGADPGDHTEFGSFKALEGKTWNHPVVVGSRLYLRNAQEAACFELPLARKS